MGQIVWSHYSRESLKEIYKFYSEKSDSAAKRIVNGIIFKAESLKPNIKFEKLHGLPGDIRRVIFEHYKIVYRIEGVNIRILDVIDARQDPKSISERIIKWE